MKADLKLECEAYQFPFDQTVPDEFKNHGHVKMLTPTDWLIKLPWGDFMISTNVDFAKKVTAK